MSNAEELAKYKKLLDDRVITQEDFDKKKAVSYTHLTLPTNREV